MAVKSVVISSNLGPWLSVDYDFVEFLPNFLGVYTEATDQRMYYSWGEPILHKVTVSPVGVPYPGDAVPGNGSKRVTVSLIPGGGSVVTMTLVDNVDFSTGWVIITKGDHVVAYAPDAVNSVAVEPN